MWTLCSHTSPSRMIAKPSLSWAPDSRSALTSVPCSTRPASSLSRNSYLCDASRLLATSPGATLRFLPLATAPTLGSGMPRPPVTSPLGRASRDVELDAPARRIDLAHEHAHGVADADRRARLLADQDRALLVELPPVPAQLAGGQEALEAVAEGHERAGADEPDDLAVVLAADLALEEQALEQEGVGDVVGVALDLHRVALAPRGPLGRLVEHVGAGRVVAAGDGAEQRAVADEVGVAPDRRGEVAVGRRVQARVALVLRRVARLLERAQDQRRQPEPAAAAAATHLVGDQARRGGDDVGRLA